MSKKRRPNREQVCGSGTGSYEVQSGDTMWDISRGGSGEGSNYDQIQNMDGSALDNPDLIHPGQILDVSGVCGAEEDEETEQDVGSGEVAVGGSGITAVDPNTGDADPVDVTAQAGPSSGSSGSTGGPFIDMPATQGPVGAGRSAGEPGAVGPGAGTPELDQLLNQESSTEQFANIATEVDWLDELNAVRNNDMGAAGINAVERLIPVYGMYDGVRDNWNTLVSRAAHMPDDNVLKFIMAAEFAVGTVAEIVRHLGYLFAIVQAFVAATGIGAVPSTLGGYSIGLIINAILFVLDGINMLLGVAGAGWSGLMLAMGGLDELEKAQYEYMLVDQVEHTMVSGIHMVVDVAAGVLANYLPSAALSEGVKAGIPLLAGATGIGLRGVSTGVARYMMGEVGEATDFGAKPEPRFDPATHSLPKDIVGDAAFIFEHPIPGMPSLDLFSEETRGRLVNGTERPGMNERTTMGTVLDPTRWFTPPSDTISSLGPMNFSPDQISGLADIETDILGGLATSDASMSALDTFAADQDASAAAFGSAELALTDLAVRQQGVVSTVDSAMPQAQSGLEGQQTAETSIADAGAQFGVLGGHLSEAVGKTSGQAEAPEQEDDRNILERGADWVYDQTIGRLVDQLNDKMSTSNSMSSGGAAQAQSSQGASGAAGATASQQGEVVSQSIAGGEEARSGAGASAASLTAEAVAVATARDTAAKKAEEARGFAVLARADHERMQSNLALVQAERVRQETSMAGFAAAVGPMMAGPKGMDTAQENLLVAWDMLSDLSDSAASEVTSAANRLPGAASKGAMAVAEAFAMRENMRLAGLVSVLSGVADVAAVQTAVAMLLGAEASIIAARDDALAAMAEAEIRVADFDEEAAVGPAQDTAQPNAS